MNFKSNIHVILCSILLLMLGLACSENSIKKQSVTPTFSQGDPDFQHDSLPFVCLIDTPIVTDSFCSGTYRGVEFIPPGYIKRLKLNGTDIAHQYSNLICSYVGHQLKELYRSGKYSKVNFSKIKLQTNNMGKGENYVEYSVYIPFVRVPKSSATTAFDHCGGWGHRPEIDKRKKDLLMSAKKIVKNKRLIISRLFKTEEGLQEYWIQWQHSAFQ